MVVEGNEHLSKRHGIWTQKRAKLDSQDLLRRNHPAGVTPSSNTKMFTPFDNPERQFRTRKNTTPLSVYNIYSFYESESSKSDSEEMGEIDIETLILEQYLALEQDNTFAGNESEDAFEHLRKVQEIASWFNTPGFSNETVMLKGFHISLVETAKRWFERTPSGAVETWDRFKQTFIQRQECAMKLEPSHDIPFIKVDTFTEKVKRRIIEDNENGEKFLRKV
ncbi:hypothetical protein Tco_0967012 [Tanacetum coccineum]